MSTIELNKFFFKFIAVGQILDLAIFVCLSSLEELTERMFVNQNMKSLSITTSVLEFISLFIEGY